MVKTGFRGERKRILTPFTYSPIRRLLPRRGGMWRRKREEMTRNEWRMTRGMWWKCLPLYILRSRGAHTQLSLAIFEGGIRDGKRVRS